MTDKKNETPDMVAIKNAFDVLAKQDTKLLTEKGHLLSTQHEINLATYILGILSAATAMMSVNNTKTDNKLFFILLSITFIVAFGIINTKLRPKTSKKINDLDEQIVINQKEMNKYKKLIMETAEKASEQTRG